jgi:hypothetical protein
MKKWAHMLSTVFPDLDKSPFRDRIFPILDAKHGKDVVDTLVGKGIPKESIVVWENNGIEFVYPEEPLRMIFGASEGMEIIGDQVKIAGTTMSKNDLALRVVRQISGETVHHPEFTEKLLERIRLLS